MPMQINVTTKVNSKTIRREQHNGREHWVIPSHTLPANVVMNGGLYTAAEIDAHYQELDGTLAPLGHPQVNGQFVSAFSAEGINVGHVGAWNRNAKKSGNRIYVEKWLDVEVARQSEGGKRLLERLEAMEKGEDVPPIHTSVAVFLDRMDANDQQRAAGAEWVAKIHGMDHDAILLDEVGAATPEQGVGLMVNADLATPLHANAGALIGESYRERESRLVEAAKARFAAGPDEYVWVEDFTSSQVILGRNGGPSELYGYREDGGKIVFDEAGVRVRRQESWVSSMLANIKNIFTNHQARPDQKQEESNMELTPEKLAELIKQASKSAAEEVAANSAATTTEAVAAAVSAAVAPLTERITALEANASAEEAGKRDAVAKAYGLSADAAAKLNGNALDELHKSLGSAAPLGGGRVQVNAETTMPEDLGAYFGGTK